MDTRKRSWQLGLAGIGLALGCFHDAAFAAQSPQIPLAAKAIPQFVQPLPKLSVQSGGTIQTVPGNQFLTLRMCEFKADVLPAAAVPGYAGTWVWGYLPDPAGTSTCSQLVTQYGNAQAIVDTYIGPVIVNDRGSATPINFVNDLGSANGTNVLAYKYSTDQTLHWADPLSDKCNHMAMPPAFGSPCAANYDGSIPAVPHLHGGEVPPELDGGPDAWFTSDGNKQGTKYYSSEAVPGNSALYKYPNTQEASPIWFHDHTLGVTRLNVYAGLAGAYFIEDPAILPTSISTTKGTQGSCATGCLPENLHPIADVIPIVIQDRMFDTGGQLFFQADSAEGILWALNPEHPYWSPEFVGDTIVVNGKAWPFLEVGAKRYRFLFLNGSNARTYELYLVNPVTKAVGPPMWVIGTDGGYLDAPVKIDPALKQKLTIMPGERYEVIIDFKGFANTNLVMNNIGRTPYPGGTPPPGTTLGKIMQFRVGGAVADASYDPATLAPLRSGSNAIVRLTTAGVPPAAPAKTRALTLNEVMGMAQNATNPVTGLMTAYPGGPLEILVNNTKWSGERITGVDTGKYTMEPIPGFINGMSERPMEGDTEVWEIINLTADAHPIHLHLVQFQLINRQGFDAAKYGARYAAAFPGGGYDPMTGLAYPAGVFIPGFGPPLNYDTGNPNAFGGNPSVTPFLKGLVNLPFPHEQGWKDTIITYPGQVTRIAVRWAPTSLPTTASAAELGFPFDPSGGGQFNYVWHCHIIDHEDNEMMRPDQVQLNTAYSGTRIVKGVDY